MSDEKRTQEDFWNTFDEHIQECAEDKRELRAAVDANRSDIKTVLEGKYENGKLKYIGLQQITQTYLVWKRRFMGILMGMVASLLTLWLVTHFDLFGSREREIASMLEALQKIP